MTLATLVTASPEVRASGGAPIATAGEVTGIVLDSRRVTHGDVWVALPGVHTHGARFAAGPLSSGIAAVLTDSDGAALLGPGPHPVPVLVSDEPRVTMARWAAALHGEPARRLTTYGVTGTNGKTTTTFLLQAALRAAGHSVGLVGTVGFRLDDAAVPGAVTSTVTTPESPDLQRILALMVDAGADALTMEVSSHALALRRVAGIEFDVAGFNNLGVDHLDFHHDLEDYFAAKALLFAQCRQAVVNIDDPYGRRLLRLLEVPVTTVSVDDPSGADVAVTAWRPTSEGSDITLRIRGCHHRATVGLPGEHNVRNAALAAGMLAAGGLTGDALEGALAGFAGVGVPGRMELVRLAPREGRATPRVLVDFAHTPQAVDAAVRAVLAEDGTAGPVVVVVGSGGDRDPGKRAPIGAAAATADVVVVTDDNPRTEDPAAIRAAVLAGAETARTRGARARTVLDGGDRRRAIRHALEMASRSAEPGTVLVLGRGHETEQLVGAGTVEFHDPTVVGEEWETL